MNLPFYISRRYLFAKKSQTAVNALTWVALVGVSFGTMALIVVLSVFNGFENLILSLFNAFNPDIEIVLDEGKTFSVDELPVKEIKNHPEVAHFGEVYEEMALLTYKNKQHIVRLRGVDQEFRYITGVDTLITEGTFELQQGDSKRLILGQGVAWILGANLNDLLNPITIYFPRRGKITSIIPSQAFNIRPYYASGVFSVQAEYDMEYVLAPIGLTRDLSERENVVTSVIIDLKNGANTSQIQSEIQSMAGDNFRVKNRFQQQEFLYKVMQSEKWAIFLILTFIMIIAAFNITGSLTMLIIEKQRDINILRSLGASKKFIRRIFVWEGTLISSGGALAGLIMGFFICYIQIQYGIITIQAQGTFIVDSYPVHMEVYDFVLVFATVSLTGLLASLIPVVNTEPKS